MDRTIRVLDLFSGIGGFSLGLERAGMETVAFCEIDPWCRRVLRKHWPDVRIFEDIRALSYNDGSLHYGNEHWRAGAIDVICGGFPCQPFSLAGRKGGTQDDRDLWPEMCRLIAEIRPTWVVGENVANFLTMAFTRTKTDLEAEGYTVQPFILPACAVGAPHRRDRAWIIAHATGERRQTGGDIREKRPVFPDQKRPAAQAQPERDGIQRGVSAADGDVANHCRQRGQGGVPQPLSGQSAFSWCEDVRGVEDFFNRPDIPQPLICRGDDGFSGRVDRLRGLGNAVVPQLVEILGQTIIERIKS